MESNTILFKEPQAKLCPFCAETIQAKAVKCRFCGEFLDTKMKPFVRTAGQGQDSSEDVELGGGHILFAGRPSLWAITATLVKGLVLVALGIFLMCFAFERTFFFRPAQGHPANKVKSVLAKGTRGLELTEERAAQLGRCRVTVGVGLIVVVLLVIGAKVIQLKMTYYEVSTDRIEYARGVLNRRVDNLDMFRVVDIKLRRSLLDCVVGVGTVRLTTTDKTDPGFSFKKVRNSRLLYDVIKRASLQADRKDGVIHLE